MILRMAAIAFGALPILDRLMAVLCTDSTKISQPVTGPYMNTTASQPTPTRAVPGINTQMAYLGDQSRQLQRQAMQNHQQNPYSQNQQWNQQQWTQQPYTGDPSNNNYFEYTPSPYSTPRSGNTQSDQTSCSATSGEDSMDAVKDYQRMLLQEQQRRNKEFGKKW